MPADIYDDLVAGVIEDILAFVKEHISCIFEVSGLRRKQLAVG